LALYNADKTSGKCRKPFTIKVLRGGGVEWPQIQEKYEAI